MNPIELYKKTDAALRGLPDEWLTAGLLLIAVVAIWAAFQKSPLLKGLVFSWMVLP